MTSPLATEDLNDLRAEGLTPSDEDVIRLHALALKITNGPETTAYNAPRFAVAGDTVFWEPTLAARYWFAFAKNFANDRSVEDVMFAFACAKGRERGYLDNLRDPNEIENALNNFVSSVNATRKEVERAVYYVSVGINDIEGEKTELEKKHERENPTDREQQNYNVLEEILSHAAAATGLTFDDLMIQTPSRLNGMIYASHVQAGFPLTKSCARAHAVYLATLKAIRERLMATRTN